MKNQELITRLGGWLSEGKRLLDELEGKGDSMSPKLSKKEKLRKEYQSKF